MNCQEIQEQLLAHRVGELDDAAAAGLRQHLETCAACRAAADEQERVLDLMRSAFAAGPVAPAQLDQRHRNRVLRAQFSWSAYGPLALKLAAVLVVGVGLVGLLLPALNSAALNGKMTGTLSNGKQIYTAAFSRNLDSAVVATPSAPAADAAPVSRCSTLARSERSLDRKTAASAPADSLRSWGDERDGGDRGGFAKNTESSKGPAAPPPQVTAPPPAKLAVGGAGLYVNGNVSGAVSGNGLVTKSGTGTLSLDGANTYSGGTIINAGTLVMNTSAVTDGRLAGSSGAAADRPGQPAQPGFAGGTTYRLGGGGGTVQFNNAKNLVASRGGVAGDDTAVLDLNGTTLNQHGAYAKADGAKGAGRRGETTREGQRASGANASGQADAPAYARWAEAGGQPQPVPQTVTASQPEPLVALRTDLPKPTLAGTPQALPNMVTVQKDTLQLNERLNEVRAEPAAGLKGAVANQDLYALTDVAKKLEDHRKNTDELQRGPGAVEQTGTSAGLVQPETGRDGAQSLGTVVTMGGGTLILNSGTTLALGDNLNVTSGAEGLSKAKRTSKAAGPEQAAADKSRLVDNNSFNSFAIVNAPVGGAAQPAAAQAARGLAVDDWATAAAPAATPSSAATAWGYAGQGQVLDASSAVKAPALVKGLAQYPVGQMAGAYQLKDAEAESDGKNKEAVRSQSVILGARPTEPAAPGDLGLVAGKDANRDDGVAKAGELLAFGRVSKRERAAEESEKTRRVNVVATAVQAKALAEPEEPKPAKPVFRAAGVNPWMAVQEQTFSTFSISVDSASFTLARRYLNGGQRPPPESVRTEEFVNYFDYAYAPPGRDLFSVHAQAARTPFCPPGVQLLKLGIKGRQMGRENRGANLTFLLDTSGSMNAPDRLDLARAALKLLVTKLGPSDRVALVTFSSRARLLLDFTPAAEQQKILAALDGIQAAGFTHLEAGLKLAYETAARGFVSGAANRIILMSDGVANVGADATAELLAQVEQYRKQGIFCSVFGLGTGTYDDTMLQALASKGNGTYLFMDSLDEARRVFVDELAATLNKIAADVKIQVEFNPRRVKQYRQLGYEQRQLKTEDFRNDAVAAGEVGSGQSVTALYQVELQGDASEPLGTVRVRGRNLETGRVEELERAITAADLAPSFEQADVRFRLAAAAAQFAEILRGSPYAEGAACADVAKVLRPVALELSLDQKVQELLRLVNAAHSAAQAAE